jgi:pyrroloquinoline quinone (PQQ) biosynthesis protein C
MMSLFSELVLGTDEDRRGFETHPAVVAAVADGLSAERYKALLLELYHVVWQFNPVCAVAASRLGTPDQDSLQPVRHFLYEHMHEEMGHENWVLNDLQAFGVGPDAARAHAPSVYTLALIGYNHWAASRRDPCSVLGMLYALEVIASVYGGPFASALRERLLLEGDAGVSFISSHATMDTEHMVRLRSVLNKLNVPDALPAVAESARVNFHHFTQIMAAV